MHRPHLDTLIFDLDGTLIDSSASILAGFAAALDDLKIAPKLPLTATVIGPPLRETLATLAGSSDGALLDSLANSFKNYYDTEGYKATSVFSGVEEMLKRIHGAGAALHIATNKRLLPTHLILKHLGWGDLFTSVYALDTRSPAFVSKAAMIADLMQDQGIVHASAAYVGDRPEDGLAADANGLPFYAAEWGYSAFPAKNTPAHWVRLTTPGDLLGI